MTSTTPSNTSITSTAFSTPPPSTLSSAATIAPPTTTATSSSSSTFQYPPYHAYPPLYTLQPNLTTLTRQLTLWRDLLLSYCQYHRIFRLTMIVASQWPLFNNPAINKRLSLKDLREVLSWVCGREGGERGEWIGGAGEKAEMWVYWKRPEEWARLVEDWVDATGQRGTVLTVYELLEGEGSVGEEFHGMDSEVMQKALGVLVKRGKAQVFGNEDQQGVKFF